MKTVKDLKVGEKGYVNTMFIDKDTPVHELGSYKVERTIHAVQSTNYHRFFLLNHELESKDSLSLKDQITEINSQLKELNEKRKEVVQKRIEELKIKCNASQRQISECQSELCIFGDEMHDLEDKYLMEKPF